MRNLYGDGIQLSRLVSIRNAAATLAAIARGIDLGLLGIVGIAALLNGYEVWRLGYANFYYAATVRSMLTSWHAFFFGSFDPAGFVTVDKPPLGFWIQAASATLLAFTH